MGGTRFSSIDHASLELTAALLPQPHGARITSMKCCTQRGSVCEKLSPPTPSNSRRTVTIRCLLLIMMYSGGVLLYRANESSSPCQSGVRAAGISRHVCI